MLISKMTKDQPYVALPKVRFNYWKLLLALPYLGLCFPGIYARSTPALLGFPFFYWYQFTWVVLAAILMGIVYRKLENEGRKERAGS